MSKPWICLALTLALLSEAPLRAADSSSRGSLEFFAGNRDGRLMVTVQVWGDVSLNGTHHVPDNTTLLQLLGFAGGLRGSLDDAKVSIRRSTKAETGHTAEVIELSGNDLIGTSSEGNAVVQNGDIVYVQASPPGEITMRNLTLISTIVAILSGSLLTYYLVKEKH